MRIMFNLVPDEGSTEVVPAVADVSFFEYDPIDKVICIFDSAEGDDCWCTVDKVDYSNYLEYARELFEIGKLDLTGTDLKFDIDYFEDDDDDYDDEDDEDDDDL